MKPKMQCPLCDSNYTRKMLCSNKECKLSTKPFEEEKDTRSVFTKLRYLSYRGARSHINNFLFNRYDKIHTNLSKSGWHDTDGRIEAGMMALVVEFVERERGLDYYFTNHKLGNDTNEVNNSDKIFDIYYDIKVTLPNLYRADSEALTEWAKDQHMRTAPIKDSDNLSVTMEYDASPAIEKERWELLQNLNIDKEKLTTDILNRIVKYRGSMWT